MTKPVRVRFAPSPTGFLHVGGARTALFNWLWARKNNGTFILRIEDTDAVRSTEESTAQILESMRWLGLDCDEGPFYQSERRDIYREHFERLRRESKIYPAFETKEELDEMRQQAMQAGKAMVYDRRSLNMDPGEVTRRMSSGEPFVWRFKVPEDGYTEVPETLLGEQTRFANEEIGDFIITRPGTLDDPGMPLYNFVCAVDDALMEITHVIRGADHLANTAKQVLLLHAFGYGIPVYTHLPLIMKAGKKMSKRDADADPRYPVSVSARRDLGYLREATVNFLALLGWSFPNDQEFFTVQELTENFTLDRLQKANANFDEDKYLHQNATYIRTLPIGELAERVRPFLERAGLNISDKDNAWIEALADSVRERVKLLSEFPGAVEYFFKDPEDFDPKGVKKAFTKEGVASILRDASDVLEACPNFLKDTIEAALREHGEKHDLKFGAMAQPIRLAVTGRTASPGLFDVLALLGKETTLRRIRRAAASIEAGEMGS